MPSSDDQSRIPCLIDHATGSWKSLTAAAMGKADPEIIETLTKRHSRRSYNCDIYNFQSFSVSASKSSRFNVSV